jgi:ubiquinone/menaquinone biosynthesis C-methylase UbiE
MISRTLKTAATEGVKEEVRSFWNAAPCGARYMGSSDDFDGHTLERYRLEPHITRFAGFAEAKGLRILEIGVGMGSDYLAWLQAGALATGVDLSENSVRSARRRCELAGHTPDLHVADAESLPFSDNSFDVVYSYGVMHHSPDTARCLHEAWRVLKPGGQVRIMIYHHPSLTGLMLWLRFGMPRRKTLRQSVYDYLESPGTKSYTHKEARSLATDFQGVTMEQVLSPGDLMMNKPSQRFQSWGYRMIWKCYPRSLVKRFARRFGLFLLITGRKPAA